MLSAVLIFVTSCSPTQGEEVAQVTGTYRPTGALTPFFTRTPEPVTPTPTARVHIPVAPSPTATPFLHTLTNDDTLLGLAFRYGVSLEDLEAANPGVDPHFLTVGKQIVIPISGTITETLPVVTPVPVPIKQTLCYPAGDGGTWCLAALFNDTQASLENLSAGIALFDSQGEVMASQIAYALLDILPPGSTMPLMAYFEPPLPEYSQVHSQVLSALAVAGDDERYLDLRVEVDSEEISQDGFQAVVSGNVAWPDNTARPSAVWFLAVAYDAQSEIVGARKVQSTGGTGFEIEVFSLGGKIDHVEVLVEARP